MNGIQIALVVLFSACLISCRQSTENTTDTNLDLTKMDTSIKEDVKRTVDDTVRFALTVDSLHHRYQYDSAWTEMTPVLPGSILPFQRILAFYGNLFSKRMGILGELPRDEMIGQLMQEKKNWELADPATPVIPALHVIVTTAQRSPGRDKMYRLRMSKGMVHKVKEMADSIGALTFLDLQVGHSTLDQEIPPWDSLLSLPTVHLGIDAEFAMYNKKVPGTVMGRFHADEINIAIDYLEEKVKSLGLPPKILIVHRFKKNMIADAHKIKKSPYVQVVMHMDGWGAKELKFHSYRAYIQKEPVQYTGFKIFYKNDTRFGKKLLTPEEVLTLTPKPLYIQYQ